MSNDPLSDFAEQLLMEWAYGHGHIVRSGECQCGASAHNAEQITAHWQAARIGQLIADGHKPFTVH